jgi:hypothetical protein
LVGASSKLVMQHSLQQQHSQLKGCHLQQQQQQEELSLWQQRQRQQQQQQ